MNSIEYVANILVGPDDGGSLTVVEANGHVVGFVSRSRLFHPVIDDIPILLPRHLRNPRLELAAVHSARAVTGSGILDWNQVIDETLRVISTAQPESEWEWEDEVFWSNEYSNMLDHGAHKNWNDRLWRNENVVNQAISRTNGFDAQTILDIGAGDAHCFREMIAGPRLGDVVYVAADVSIAALKLNRQLNPHKKAAYIVCAVGNLPFRQQSVGAVFLFGVLHHTRHQSTSLKGITGLVKDGGIILLQEGLSRPTMSDMLPMFSNRHNESAHEHRLDRKEFAGALRSEDLEILSYDEHSTLFYGGLMRVLNRWIVKWRPLFKLILNVDRVIAKSLGRITKLFAGGEVLALLRVARTSE